MTTMTLFHLVAPILFALLVTWWLGSELGHRHRPLRAGWLWLAGATALQILAAILADAYDPYALGNVLLHAVGGGCVAALLFLYGMYTLRVSISWRLQLAMLFCFVSVLGTLNELLEFGMELLNIGVYSFGARDTWRDMAANTGGAVAMWSIVKAVQAIATRH